LNFAHRLNYRAAQSKKQGNGPQNAPDGNSRSQTGPSFKRSDIRTSSKFNGRYAGDQDQIRAQIVLTGPSLHLQYWSKEESNAIITLRPEQQYKAL